ncbi:MAG: hydroxyacylglutathione hydrolase C-terminal domain-containing protein [Ostreibacterium sp.]
MPTYVEQELQTNPFVRADQPELQSQLNMLGYPADQVFAEIRQRKDRA